jgi:predicted XRE-type DNA-binding protein
MPRIASKKKEYKISDLTKYIRNEMYSQGIQQREMAEKLDISQPQLSHKLKNSIFSYKDLLIIFSFLKTEDEEILKIMKM